jgi:hypothetical protein
VTSSAAFSAVEAALLSIGSTAGRGFETAISPYVWGALLIVGLLLWVVFERDIRKWKREERQDSEHDDTDS